MSHTYCMPAEWHAHDATWLAWPHQLSDWPGKFECIPHLYVEIVRLLAEVERVCILLPKAGAKNEVKKLLARAGVNLDNVELHVIKTDRSWIRDYGPIFVHDDTGRVVASDWVFNGWAKYRNHENDNAVPVVMAEVLRDHHNIETDIVQYDDPHYGPRGVVLEGGAIDVNGAGCLLTTEECLLSTTTQVRNRGMSRDDYAAVLQEALGAETVIWLGRGIAGDDTHGHVDDVARFVNEQTIVCCSEPDSRDENYRPMQENLERLRAARDPQGRKFDIVELPMPKPVNYDGQRLPASYANFYIANDLVLVPTFHDENDRVALALLADLFPGRRVVGVHGVDLVWGFGTLHCMTQQQPARLEAKKPEPKPKPPTKVAKPKPAPKPRKK